MTFKDQPAYIIKMRAKAGMGDRLFELATEGMAKSGASDRFTILREDADPDVLWNVEVFRSEQAKDAYESSALADELRDEIIGLLAEAPMRIAAHPYSAIPTLPAAQAESHRPQSPPSPATAREGERPPAPALRSTTTVER